MRTLTLLLAAAGLVASAAATAAADPVVLSVDRGLAYVDLGGHDGVGEGTELELVREVVVRDPVSGATLRDRFALGRLTVTRAGARVCEARPDQDLAGRVRAGDGIRIVSEVRTFADPWLERVATSKQVTPDLPAPTVTGPGVDRALAARAVEEADAARDQRAAGPTAGLSASFDF